MGTGIKRRRLGRNRTSRYLSPRQKKHQNLGRVIFIIAAVVTLVAASFITTAAYAKHSKEREAEERRLREIEAASEEERSSIEASLAEAEAILRQIQEKKEARKLLTDKVHAVDPNVEFPVFPGSPTLSSTGDAVLDEAYRLAAGYDYEAALSLIRNVTGYVNKPGYVKAEDEFIAAKSAARQWKTNNNITHVFFHSLIVDPSRTFDYEITSYKITDYNKAMTTVSEFVRMMEEMYRKGYVLVDIYDVAKMEVTSDGTEKMTYQKIFLPEGKTPFILSIDDTNYYEYMTGHGFATKLVLEEDGTVTNEYVLSDGTTVRGPFDVIPILEEFIKYHPDFSYRGARGIAGITGYNGVLGYRTSDYWYSKDCPYYEATDANERYKLEETSGTNWNIENDKKTATEVADAIKALGWRFSSHTWGHYRLGQIPMEKLVWDSDMWEREVKPILGDTDILIFPYGNDIGTNGSWREYDHFGYNERYETLKGYGFRYFLNVDSSQFFMQRTDEYFRQGRRNLDGERMWQAIRADQGDTTTKNRLSDLFDDVAAIIDPFRPALYK